MAGDYYNIEPKKTYYVIDYINNGLFTLCFMAFLGPASKKFNAPFQFGFSVQQIQCGEFSIAIIWSWLSLPPHGHSRFSFVSTNRPYHVATEGFDENRCIAMFFELREGFRKTMIDILTA